MTFLETGGAADLFGKHRGQLTSHRQVEGRRQLLRKTEFTGGILELTELTPARRRNKGFVGFPVQ